MTIKIGRLTTISPSLAEVMRACMLRAGFARSQDVSPFVLGNPGAWLGNAYHEVLWRVATFGRLSAPFQEEIQRLWSGAIENQYRRALSHPLDQRFGKPESWPGYYFAYASLSIRAKDCVNYQNASGESQNAGYGFKTTARTAIREQEFAAFGGKLKGRPDVVLRDQIIDYKSGNVLEEPSLSVKAAYVRQLQVYAFLVNEVLGYWPRRGTLLPAVGPGVEVDLDPLECRRVSTESVTLLDAYNESLVTILDPVNLGSPGQQTCRWCPYQLVCPAFWNAICPEWSKGMGEVALEGMLVNDPRPVLSGTAYSLSMRVLDSTADLTSIVVAPLDPSVHTTAGSLRNGDRVRIVGLQRRIDGAVLPSMRTVVLRHDDIPQVAFSQPVEMTGE